MTPGGEPGYPQRLVDTAARVKAGLQMLIGVYAVGWLVWAFLLSHRVGNCVPPAGAGNSSVISYRPRGWCSRSSSMPSRRPPSSSLPSRYSPSGLMRRLTPFCLLSRRPCSSSSGTLTTSADRTGWQSCCMGRRWAACLSCVSSSLQMRTDRPGYGGGPSGSRPIRN